MSRHDSTDHASPLEEPQLATPVRMFSVPRALALAVGGLAFVGTVAMVQPLVSGASDRGSRQTFRVFDRRAGQSERTLIGTLYGRSYVVEIYTTSSSAEAVYDVLDTEGRVLAEGVPQLEVYRLFPDLDIRELHFGPDAVGRQLMLADPETGPE